MQLRHTGITCRAMLAPPMACCTQPRASCGSRPCPTRTICHCQLAAGHHHHRLQQEAAAQVGRCWGCPRVVEIPHLHACRRRWVATRMAIIAMLCSLYMSASHTARWKQLLDQFKRGSAPAMTPPWPAALWQAVPQTRPLRPAARAKAPGASMPASAAPHKVQQVQATTKLPVP